MFCIHCGTPLSDDARFCTSCGQPVEEETPEPEPTPEPAPEPIPEPAPAPPPPPPPPYGAPAGGYAPPPPVDGGKKKSALPVVIALIAAALLAAAGFLIYRFVSERMAFEEDISLGRAAMEEGDYDAAIAAYESALARRSDDPIPALELAEACLYAGDAGRAGALLDELELEEGHELLPQRDRLRTLAATDPSVEEIDTSAFPAVTVTLDLGSDLTLNSTNVIPVEDGIVRDITGLEQEGSTVRFTYRTDDTDVSEEPRSLEAVVAVDGLTFEDYAEYLTPYFEPAQLTLVTTDVSEYPTVKAYFRVSNANSGENVEGLTTNSFTILERINGGEYLAREVKSAMPLEDNAGLNINLVADKSDSISPRDMNKIKSVMTEFVNSLHYGVGDKAELLAFDSIVQQMCYYTGNVDLLVNGINNMSTDGLTAFYDAVYDGVTNAALQGGARCVIAFTDGMDNRSAHSANEVVSYASLRQVPVYIIGVGSSVDANTLRSMAENTGGRYWHINDLYDLQEIFNQIYSEQKDLYVVEYESDADQDSYTIRDLSVRVSGGGCRGETEASFAPARSIKDEDAQRASRYELITECLSWEEASRRCQEMGGHLATITSQAEMDLVVSMAEAAGMNYIWLGGYTSYDDNGNVFGHWVTGEEFSYQPWSADEPSRVDLDGTEEWYIMLWNMPSLGGWTWNDQRNDPAAIVTSMADEMAYICEFEV